MKRVQYVFSTNVRTERAGWTQSTAVASYLVFCQGSFEGSQTPQNFL
jgi:hypothetical protein